MFQDTGSDVGGRYPHRRSGMRLITQRSQVQILPPLQVKSQVSNLEPFGLAVAREDSLRNLRVRGPFDLRIEGASGVRDRTVTADAATGCGWMWVHSGVLGGRSEAVWSRMSLPAFDAAKKMAAPAAATGSMSSVSAVVSTCRPSGSRGENVRDDGGDDGADDGRADAGARVGERPPGRPHARSHGGPSGGVETRLQAGLALERGLSGRAVDCMGEGSALFLHRWCVPAAGAVPGSRWRKLIIAVRPLVQTAGMRRDGIPKAVAEQLVIEHGDQGQRAVEFLKTALELLGNRGAAPRIGETVAYCIREALGALAPTGALGDGDRWSDISRRVVDAKTRYERSTELPETAVGAQAALSDLLRAVEDLADFHASDRSRRRSLIESIVRRTGSPPHAAGDRAVTEFLDAVSYTHLTLP